jgi:hypothetical protein
VRKALSMYKRTIIHLLQDGVLDQPHAGLCPVTGGGRRDARSLPASLHLLLSTITGGGGPTTLPCNQRCFVYINQSLTDGQEGGKADRLPAGRQADGDSQAGEQTEK